MTLSYSALIPTNLWTFSFSPLSSHNSPLRILNFRQQGFFSDATYSSTDKIETRRLSILQHSAREQASMGEHGRNS